MRGSTLTIIMLLFTFTMNAQISAARKATKRAEQKVTDRIIEKTMNGIVDKLFGPDSTKTSTDPDVKTDSTVTANSNPFGGLFSAKTVDKQYSFNITVDMEYKIEDKKGEGDVIPMRMHYSQDSSYIATEVSSAVNITDYNELKNYMIVGGNVTIIDLKKAMEKAEKRREKEKPMDVNVEKSGKQETIAGYLCEEYVVETEDSEGSFWITNELQVDGGLFGRAMEQNETMSVPPNMQGTILRMKMVDKKNKTTTHMDTKEITKQEISYDLSKYKATDLSRFGF